MHICPIFQVGNELNGTIPSELGKLKKLQLLNLGKLFPES